MKSNWLHHHAVRLLATVNMAMLSISCGELARTGRSPAFIVVDALEAASGAAPDAFGNVLNSDVETLVDQQVDGRQTSVPVFFSDTGRATLRLGLKNPGDADSPLRPSALNEITVTRYHVRFRRADGRNTPGVDVPHAFDGGVTVTIPADATASLTFAVVRHQAKLEPPLNTLRRGGGANVISTIAEITFYGRDQAGHDVAVMALLSVNFADFHDPR